MERVTVLPADTYVVINKAIITNEVRKTITMLYQPIIGYSAVSLYFTLLDDLDKRELMSEDFTHYHLMANMQLKLDDIVRAREKLEGIGLLKTYYKKGNVNNFVYLIFSPLSPNEFLNHPILNVVLYNNLGKTEYDKLVAYYKKPTISFKDYTDITKRFNEVFDSVSSGSYISNENIIDNEVGGIRLNNILDFDLIISSIPSELVNQKCFNDETKELLNALACVYKIDSLNMQGLIRSALNEKGMIDKLLIRKLCRNFYQFENDGKLPTLIYSKQPEYLKKPIGDTSKKAKMIYTFENVTPYDFLRSAYNNAEPTIRDLTLIEKLMVDQQLKPGVVNVLIDYVLKINNKKLNKNYIETIAGQWKRLNIETVEDAMKMCEKEHKKFKKQLAKPITKEYKVQGTPKKEIDTPNWFDKELEKEELGEDEKRELDDILKEFSN